MKQPRRFIIPVFIPHEGCRFRCIFCDQHVVSGRTAPPVTPDEIRDIVLRYRETSPRWPGERELAFFGGSFTLLDAARQEELLEAGSRLIREEMINALRVSTRPDGIDEGILSRLTNHGVRTVEIGVQSMDESVLRASRRGHTVSDTLAAVDHITKRGVSWIAQIMPGLPGDTHETMIRTASRVADLAPDGVRIYPALTLSGTGMERLYRTGEYAPLSLDQAVDVVKTMMRIFESRSIPVIRIGLCPSIELEKRVVSGPYHPAMGSLVYEARMLDAMIAAVDRTETAHGRTIIAVNPRDVSRAVGTGRSSIEKLHRCYPDRRFDVVADDTVQRGRVHTRVV
jgi:histone acetyltransferase (RNA polymerase elongator complex component)